jgi:hypothetical protein
MITLSIDVNKIDKSRFFTRKNGARMLDLVLIETPNSKYDTDYMVVQSTKEERAKGVKLPPIGNAKIIATKGNRSALPGYSGPGREPQGGGQEDW